MGGYLETENDEEIERTNTKFGLQEEEVEFGLLAHKIVGGQRVVVGP